MNESHQYATVLFDQDDHFHECSEKYGEENIETYEWEQNNHDYDEN